MCFSSFFKSNKIVVLLLFPKDTGAKLAYMSFRGSGTVIQIIKDKKIIKVLNSCEP